MGEKKEMPVNKDGFRKLTYEQLEALCGTQSQQMERMQQEIKRYRDALQQMDLNNLYHRLDFLMRIVSDREKYPVAFVDSAVNEIVAVMTIHEEEPDNHEEDADDANVELEQKEA